MHKRTAWGLVLLVFGGGIAALFALRGSSAEYRNPTFQSGARSGGALDAGIGDFEAERFDRARAFFEQHLETYPGEPEAVFYLGRIAIEEARPIEAGALFEQVIEARPDDARAHYWLAGALGREALTANKLRQVVLAPRIREHFERAVELDGDFLDARKRLVDFYTQAPVFMGGGMDKARAQVAEIERIDAYEGCIARALVEQLAGDPAAALHALAKAVELTESADAATDEARSVLAAYAELELRGESPRDVPLRMLGEVWEKLGHPEHAAKAHAAAQQAKQ